uniref:Uncharacterized protein n=1 Tax=viral metagenome TaxID=1070528 RepID=A0A6C0KWD8_9ZZZZ
MHYAFINETQENNEFADRQSLGGAAPSTPYENRIKEYKGWIANLPSQKPNSTNNNDLGDRSSLHAIPSTEWENQAKEYTVQINPSMNKQYNVKPKCVYNAYGMIVCPAAATPTSAAHSS